LSIDYASQLGRGHVIWSQIEKGPVVAKALVLAHPSDNRPLAFSSRNSVALEIPIISIWCRRGYKGVRTNGPKRYRVYGHRIDAVAISKPALIYL
jgi:hypothetical protein